MNWNKTLRLMIVLLLQLIPLTEPPPASGAMERKNSLRREGNIVIINVPIDLFVSPRRRFRAGEQRGLTAQQLADIWETNAENIWNEGLGDLKFRGCYTLQVDIQFGVITSREQVRQGTHRVRLRRTGYRSNVNHGGKKGQDSLAPYQGSRTGQWGIIRPDSVAHEVGHFLGLGDDYLNVYDEDGNRIGFKENPGREGTMMANYRSNPEGRVDQEIVDRLGDLLKEVEKLPPCISGFWEGEWEKDHGQGHTSTAELFLSIELKPNEEGELEGTATGTFDLYGVKEEGDCSFNYSTSANIELELKATGSDDGPYEIDAEEPQKVEGLQRHYLCDQAYDLTIDWEIGMDLSDVIFEEGKYEYEDEDDKIVLGYGELEP